MKINKRDYEKLLAFYMEFLELLKAKKFDEEKATGLVALRNDLARRVPIIQLSLEKADLAHSEAQEEHASELLQEIRFDIFEDLVIPYGRDSRVKKIWEGISEYAVESTQERKLIIHIRKSNEFVLGAPVSTIFASNHYLFDRLLEGTLPNGVEVREC